MYQIAERCGRDARLHSFPYQRDDIRLHYWFDNQVTNWMCPVRQIPLVLSERKQRCHHADVARSRMIRKSRYHILFLTIALVILVLLLKRVAVRNPTDE